MNTQKVSSQAVRRPWRSHLDLDCTPFTTLTLIFLAWKSLLLLLALSCPGAGYDTSSFILYTTSTPPEGRRASYSSLGPIDRLTLRLFSWDALYFVEAAQRGYLYEQEWAFSRTYSRILGFLGRHAVSDATVRHYIWAGVATANICHFISVLVLYRLVRLISGGEAHPRIAFLSAVLHILSPAGFFLSAPYTESMFSALNFSGMLLYCLSKEGPLSYQRRTVAQDGYLVGSGTLFAVGTLLRGNGLLSGLIFLHDVLCTLPLILHFRFDLDLIRRVTLSVTAGLLIAVAFVGPQVVAYQEFCTPNELHLRVRPWCHNRLPGIYSWVQSHYWNVGFLRYWTLSNLPLFFLAAPMVWLLVRFGIIAMSHQYDSGVTGSSPSKPQTNPNQGRVGHAGNTRLLQLALPQLVLAVTAITSFHVQIVNRICSGYPIWYYGLAKWLTEEDASAGNSNRKLTSQWAIRWMVIYAIVQGVLFANFLPPA